MVENFAVPSLVGLHGLGGSPADLDQLGSFGAHEAFQRWRTQSTRDVFRSARAAVAPGLGSGPVIVVAYSAGGILALAYALLDTRVRDLILIDPTHPRQFLASAKQIESRIWAQHELWKRMVATGVLSRNLPRRSATAEEFSAAVNAWKEARYLKSWCDQVSNTAPSCSISVVLSEAAVRADPIYADLWTSGGRGFSVTTIRAVDHFTILQSEATEQLLLEVTSR